MKSIFCICTGLCIACFARLRSNIRSDNEPEFMQKESVWPVKESCEAVLSDPSSEWETSDAYRSSDDDDEFIKSLLESNLTSEDGAGSQEIDILQYLRAVNPSKSSDRVKKRKINRKSRRLNSGNRSSLQTTLSEEDLQMLYESLGAIEEEHHVIDDFDGDGSKVVVLSDDDSSNA